MQQRTSWSRQAVWEGVCLILLASLIAYWLWSGTYAFYVTPRLWWPLWFIVVLVSVWGGQRLSQRHGRQYRNTYQRGWIVLLPSICIAVSFTPVVQTAAITPYMGEAPVIEAEPWTQEALGASVPSDEKKETGPGIIFQTDTYYHTLLETTQQLDDRLGERVVITGMVVRDSRYYTKGDFMIARLAMTCCVADVVPLGLVVFVEHPEAYRTGAWYRVEGILRANSYHGMNQAAIQATRITPAKPIPGYVYP